MVYICIPSRDEDRTVGVLLWKIRQVMTDLGRDFRVIVLDDGSRDGTRALLEKYKRVLPLTVISGKEPIGYGRAVEKLLRAASGHTRYPKRDAIVTMQGDFTEHPDHLPALVKSFEGGADIVFGEPVSEAVAPPFTVRLARRLARFVLGRRFGTAPPGDPLQGFRAYRAIVVRKALREARNRPLVNTDGWAANAELMNALTPHARRVASVPLEKRYDMRRRPTRVRVLATIRQILRLRRIVPRPAVIIAAALALAGPVPGSAQQAPLVLDSLRVESHKVGSVPFAPGEEMRFTLRAGILGGGEAQMTVGEVDTLNGFSTYPVEWRIEASALGFGMDEKFYSWLDTESLISRRFVKDQHTAGRKRYREYDFHPEQRLVHRIDYDTTFALPTALPLDDISFVYFARTLPLEVGETYTFSRFYKNDGNPIILKVLRKDRMEVPAGTFNTIVVQPILPDNNLFASGAEAEIHFSDDERRLVVFMRADPGIIWPTIEMKLEGAEPTALGHAEEPAPSQPKPSQPAPSRPAPSQPAPSQPGAAR